jgi:hypothetical protein
MAQTMKLSERDIQSAVFQWRRVRVNQEPRLRWLHAIPNGSQRTGPGWGTALAEGLTRGVPDMCLPVPELAHDSNRVFHGLYIEVKTLNGQLTQEQEEWINGLRSMNYRAEICRTVDQTIDTICHYLRIERGY